MKTLLLLSISPTIPKALGKNTSTTNQNNTPSNHRFQNAQTIRVQPAFKFHTLTPAPLPTQSATTYTLSMKKTLKKMINTNLQF